MQPDSAAALRRVCRCERGCQASCADQQTMVGIQLCSLGITETAAVAADCTPPSQPPHATTPSFAPPRALRRPELCAASRRAPARAEPAESNSLARPSLDEVTAFVKAPRESGWDKRSLESGSGRRGPGCAPNEHCCVQPTWQAQKGKTAYWRLELAVLLRKPKLLLHGGVHRLHAGLLSRFSAPIGWCRSQKGQQQQRLVHILAPIHAGADHLKFNAGSATLAAAAAAAFHWSQLIPQLRASQAG